ncbi:MAG: hypothetical protein GTO18_14295 [Anaerolineales bacterium]|nr:hypothetical protein [Anaerolineales bacterium]
MENPDRSNGRSAPHPPSVEEALEFAIEAIDRGDLKLGNQALGWVLQKEPENPVAWLWMACTVSGEDEKRNCYNRISV